MEININPTNGIKIRMKTLLWETKSSSHSENCLCRAKIYNMLPLVPRYKSITHSSS